MSTPPFSVRCLPPSAKSPPRDSIVSARTPPFHNFNHHPRQAPLEREDDNAVHSNLVSLPLPSNRATPLFHHCSMTNDFTHTYVRTLKAEPFNANLNGLHPALSIHPPSPNSSPQHPSRVYAACLKADLRRKGQRRGEPLSHAKAARWRRQARRTRRDTCPPTRAALESPDRPAGATFWSDGLPCDLHGRR